MEEKLQIEEATKDKVYKDNPSMDGIFKVLKVKETIKNIPYRDSNNELRTLRINERKEIRNNVKFYEDSNALDSFLQLSSPAQKLAVYAIRKTEKGKTHFYYISSEFCEAYKVSPMNVSRAVNELLEKGWIYKSNVYKKYWINMSFFFKGSVEALYYKSETGKREFL